MDGAAAPRRRARRELTAIGALTWPSGSPRTRKVIVQGMTGSEGTQAHPADARLRHPRRRRRQPAQGRHHGRLRRHRRSRSSARVAEAIEGDRRRRVGRLRARRRSPRPRSIEAIDAEIPLAVVITEGIPVHDTAAFCQLRRTTRHDPHHRPELPRPDQPRQVQRRHHPGRHHRAPAASGWSRSPAR